MKPVLQALVLAERVYQDISGKYIICGTFNGLQIRKDLPTKKEVEAPDGTKKVAILGGADPGSLHAYISLTDVCDNTRLQLQFVSLKLNKVLFSTGVTIQCQDRLTNVEMAVGLPPLPIKEAGAYAFEIVWENEIVGSHRIVAQIIE